MHGHNLRSHRNVDFLRSYLLVSISLKYEIAFKKEKQKKTLTGCRHEIPSLVEYNVNPQSTS